MSTRAKPEDFEAVFRQLPQPCLLLSREFVILDANDAFLRLSGSRLDELLGQSATQGLGSHADEESIGALSASLQRVVSDARPGTIPLFRSGSTGTGSSIWISSQRPVLDARGEVQLIVQEFEVQDDGQAGAAGGAASASSLSQPSTGTPLLSILLVEDNEGLLATTSEYIEELGHAVTAVASAEEALRALEDRSFDLLFSDVSLPGISGLTLAREVRSRYPRMRLILSSGYGPDLGAGQLGPEVIVLSKPYDISLVEGLLEDIAAELHAGS